MLSTNTWIDFRGIAFHADLTILVNSVRFFGFCGRLYTALLTSCHRVSIGLRSGLWAGHGRNCISLASRAAAAILEVCGLALSSWKIPLPRGNTFRMVGNAYRRR